MGRYPDMILAVDGSRIVRHRKQSKVESETSNMLTVLNQRRRQTTARCRVERCAQKLARDSLRFINMRGRADQAECMVRCGMSLLCLGY